MREKRIEVFKIFTRKCTPELLWLHLYPNFFSIKNLYKHPPLLLSSVLSSSLIHLKNWEHNVNIWKMPLSPEIKHVSQKFWGIQVACIVPFLRLMLKYITNFSVTCNPVTQHASDPCVLLELGRWHCYYFTFSNHNFFFLLLGKCQTLKGWKGN